MFNNLFILYNYNFNLKMKLTIKDRKGILYIKMLD